MLSDHRMASRLKWVSLANRESDSNPRDNPAPWNSAKPPFVQDFSQNNLHPPVGTLDLVEELRSVRSDHRMASGPKSGSMG